MSRIGPGRKKRTRASQPGGPSISPAISSRTAGQFIRQRIGTKPRLAIVLGTGFGEVAGMLESPIVLPYGEIPGLTVPTVVGHAGCLLSGRWENVPLLVFNGRSHYYEGYTFAEVTFAMRILAELEVESVVLTNAAGAIHPRFGRGEFMALTDHINFLGDNPLRGPLWNGEPRFIDLTEVYDSKLRQLLQRAARQVRVRLRTGVYLAVPGPSYETPAEIRAFRRMGADAVGMSTVAEAIVARAGGLRVVGLSALTNSAAGLAPGSLNHTDVLQQGRRMSRSATKLLREFVRLYGKIG